MERQTAIEEVVRSVWCDVLEVASANADDNLFDVGGTSLAAMRMASRLSDSFDVRISMDMILHESTLQSVVRAVEQALRTHTAAAHD